MGEVADLILRGRICELCSAPFADETGFVRECAWCGAEEAEPVRPPSAPMLAVPLKAYVSPLRPFRCRDAACRKTFGTIRAADRHARDTHWRSR